MPPDDVGHALVSPYPEIRLAAVITLLDMRSVQLAATEHELMNIRSRNRAFWKRFDSALWKDNGSS